MYTVAVGTLYIVATPIGNLKDISLRAIEVLQKVSIIACEDTRRTGVLLQNILPVETYVVETPTGVRTEVKKRKLLSYYDQNEFKRIPEILGILQAGSDVALVSDAGTPTISDPGFKLVRECIRERIKVESIPGPSSVISSLVVSGLPTDKFLFVGYLPRKEGHRKTLLNNITMMIRIIRVTVIFFEAPHRLVKTLKEFKEIVGDIEIVIARELTKIHEEVRREKISEAIIHFEKTNPKGEFVLLFNIKENKNG